MLGKLMCKVGLHRWEPTIFVNGDPGLDGEACERCNVVRVETPKGWFRLPADDDDDDWVWTPPPGCTCGGRGRPCFECVDHQDGSKDA